MPIGLTTDETFDFVLPRHKPLPKDKRPSLTFRHMTGRERIALEAAFDDAKSMGNAAYCGRVYDLLRGFLMGWRNQPCEYDPAKLEDVTRWEDMLEIKMRWSSTAMGLDDNDEKKSS